MSLALPSPRDIATAISRPMSRFSPRRLVAALWGLSALVGMWAVAGYWLAHNPTTAPFAGFGPAPTLTRLWAMLLDESVLQAATPSVTRVAVGLACAITIGAPVGILVGRVRFFRDATYIPFQFLRMVSPLAWMPIAILMFPSWDGAIVFLIAAAAVRPIIFSVASGLRKLDPDWFKVAQNLGAGAWGVITSVVVPAIAQDILTGIRLAAGVAWIVLVPAEYLARRDCHKFRPIATDVAC